MPRRPTAKSSGHEVRGPRKYLRYPEQFGVVPDPQPRQLPATQHATVKAALVQHAVAREVNEQMPRLEISYAELANAVGVTAEQLRRLLRGESAMSVERMHQLARATGLRIAITVERTE